MNITRTYKYYTRNGVPGKETTIIETPSQQVVSISNKMMPGDVTISTEQEYNTLVNQHQTNMQQNRETIQQSTLNSKQLMIAAIEPKLASLGLTQSEMNFLLGTS